ncbi:nuclear transport factor 2 family protein [Streptomyces sp. NRRL B-1347]|uniref:nuclear transport factor 2 family protein n=1 Tax=Streptomyces sp. NRRL B-1347 TaxID=1476877 RepID=UPI0004CBF54A|nr:nuclear transport factor 2 family protein [Streptomyces sp. NRRL B-1347]
MNPQPSAIDLDRMAADFLTAVNSRDAKAYTALFAPDIVYGDMGFHLTFNGQTELEKWYADWFEAFPDCTVSLRNGFISGNSAVMEWEFTATLEGSFHTVPDTMRGKTRTVQGVAIVQLDAAGKIKTHRDYWSVPDLIT